MPDVHDEYVVEIGHAFEMVAEMEDAVAFPAKDFQVEGVAVGTSFRCQLRKRRSYQRLGCVGGVLGAWDREWMGTVVGGLIVHEERDPRPTSQSAAEKFERRGVRRLAVANRSAGPEVAEQEAPQVC